MKSFILPKFRAFLVIATGSSAGILQTSSSIEALSERHKSHNSQILCTGPTYTMVRLTKLMMTIMSQLGTAPKAYIT